MLEKDDPQKVDSNPSKFQFREKAPTPKTKLNAKSVLVAAFTFSALSAVVLIVAFSGSAVPEAARKSYSRDAIPSDEIAELPGDYNELAKRRVVVTPQKTEQPTSRVLREEGESEEEKLARELRLAKLRRALEARESELSFTGVRTGGSGGSVLGGGISDSGLLGMAGLKLGDAEGAAMAAAGLNPRDEASRQDEKREFLERLRSDETTLPEGIKEPLSPYQVMAGTIIPGLLLTGINSDLPGQILGQVSQNVYDSVSGDYLLIPQGTKVLGAYDSRIVYGQERVLVVWTRLLFPNGNSINLEGMPGVDMSGYAGLSDEVNNHYFKLLTGVVLSSVLGAGAQIAEGGTATQNQNFTQLAAQGAAKSINDVGQEITRRNLNIQPTLEITPGFRFNLFVTKDVVLEPYEER
jgi:type IV secretory pathway VirB10-like protein